MGFLRKMPGALAGVTDGWFPWPAGIVPDLHVAQGLGTYHDSAVALLGDGRSGPRGRYGIVGLAESVTALRPGLGALCGVVESRPDDTLRVVLLGYEMGLPHVHLPLAAAPANQPHGLCADLGAYLLVDHGTRTMAWGGPDHAMRMELMGALRSPPRAMPPLRPLCMESAVDDATHTARLRRVLEAIAAGDIYQANLTRQLHVHGPLEGTAALTALAQLNPVAHGAWLRLGGVELVSSTMETLLHFDAGASVAHSYPIKGTCARCESSVAGEAAALRADPKERAEHVMIVDLVRNDLGRLACPGGVDVPEFMGIEPYRGVWHGVSTVRARVDAAYHAGHVLEALFPGGSIVGAPKRRAMQVLQGIEETPRGFYTGSLGVLTPRGDAHFSILIRTLVQDGAGWHLGVGGGIVADSNPERELAEMNEKVAVFRRALNIEPAKPRSPRHPARQRSAPTPGDGPTH